MYCIPDVMLVHYPLGLEFEDLPLLDGNSVLGTMDIFPVTRGLTVPPSKRSEISSGVGAWQP